MTAYECEVTFGGDENNLELCSSGDSWFKHIENLRNVYFTGVNYMVLYLKETVCSGQLSVKLNLC